MAKTKFIILKTGLFENRLTTKENVVLSYLCSLNQKAYCFASNKHLCDTLKINDRTIYRILNSLEEKELIKRNTVSLGNLGKDRKIYINPKVKQAYQNAII
jgi:DNA-binding MarR family transcriptional regulator